MEAFKKRQFNLEVWELENQQQLIKIFSFALYLFYGTGKLFFSIFRALLQGNDQVDQLLEQENLKRLDLSSRVYGINK